MWDAGSSGVGAAAIARRRAFFVCAGLLLLCIGMDWAVVGHFVPGAAVVRVLWAAALLVIGRYHDSGHRLAKHWATATTTLSSVAYLAVVYFTGGSAAPQMAFAGVLPLAYVIFVQDDLRAVLWGSISCTLSALVVLALEGAPAKQFLMWSTVPLTTSVLAFYGSILFRRVLQVERSAVHGASVAMDKLKSSENQRAQTDRLAAVGRLAAGVAHEINNPLAFVKANVLLAEDEVTSGRRLLTDAELKDLFDQTNEGLDRIRLIVQDLKSLARSEEVISDAVDVGDFVDKALRLGTIRVKGRAKVVRDVSEGIPLICGDERKLSQVVLNLVVNAADALEHLTPEQEPTITVRVRHVGQSVTIAIEDNGPGIAPTVLERLFEPFLTTKTEGKGLGMGLALSQEYVQQSGGALVGENRPEGGARFTMTLSMFKDSDDDSAYLSTPTPVPQGKPRSRSLLGFSSSSSSVS